MLVLTRAVGERLIIGDGAEIVLSILDVRGNQVRVGIDAPRSVAVHREEIYLRIKSGEIQSDKPAASSKKKEAKSEIETKEEETV